MCVFFGDLCEVRLGKSWGRGDEGSSAFGCEGSRELRSRIYLRESDYSQDPAVNVPSLLLIKVKQDMLCTGQSLWMRGKKTTNNDAFDEAVTKDKDSNDQPKDLDPRCCSLTIEQ